MIGEMNSSSIDKQDIRRFGLIALVFFGALAGVAFWRDKTAMFIFFGILSLTGMCCLILPGPMTPFYRGWMRVAHKIGLTLTAIMLTIAFYGVITPAAWLKRLFGGRPLPMTPDPGKSSYWVDRTEPAQPKERFFRRY